MIEISIGIGMILSLIFTETLGVTAGGIIVPGYIALYLHDPIKIISTLLISMLTYLIIHLLSKFILIYGRRRIILSLLLGFFLGYILRTNDMGLEYVGYIIPGLIASSMDRQGVLRTISVIFIIASIVNLAMMYIYYLDQFRILYV